MSTNAGATLDFVCADLVCPVCGERPVDPCAVDIQIKFAAAPALRSYRVGDRLDVVADPTPAYFWLGTRAKPGSFRVIEGWTCPVCGAGLLWARLVVENGVLTAVDAVDLTPAVLAETDYITQEVLYLAPAESIAGLAALSPDELRNELVRLDTAWRDQRAALRPHAHAGSG
jgi:hypothetical protein